MYSTKFAIVRWMGEALCRRLAILFVFGVAGWLVSGVPALSNDDIWDTAASGTWQIGSNWLDNTTPAGSDTATFSLAGAYTVTFDGSPPAIQWLALFNNANVTFTSIGTLETQIGTLRVNTNVVILGGAILSLGTSGGLLLPSKVLHLTLGDFLTVDPESTLNVRFGSDVVTRGLSSRGQVIVSGSGSTLTATDGIRIASGSLNVTAGGDAQSFLGEVGASLGDIGTVTVSGAGSQWINTGRLDVGFQGQGTLNITAGGSVSSTDGFLGRVGSTADGTATITDGDWTMTGRLSVGGDADTGINGGTGTLNIQPAGTVSVAQDVVLFPDGLVRLQGGTLDTPAISFQGGGQFDFTAGTLHVETYLGDLTNLGGTLAPGHSAGSTTIVGNYTQNAGAKLELEIGDTSTDFVGITGNANFGGQLQLAMLGSFVPGPSDSFAVLNAAGGIVGAFTNVSTGQRLTTMDGVGSFLVNYGATSPFNANQIVLTDFLAGLLGDYNLNGVVDAADYAVWRDALTAGSMSLANDPTPGVVDESDFDYWRDHFGESLGSGSGARQAAVPEPATLTLIILAAAGWCLRRRRSA